MNLCKLLSYRTQSFSMTCLFFRDNFVVFENSSTSIPATLQSPVSLTPSTSRYQYQANDLSTSAGLPPRLYTHVESQPFHSMFQTSLHMLPRLHPTLPHPTGEMKQEEFFTLVTSYDSCVWFHSMEFLFHLSPFCSLGISEADLISMVTEATLNNHGRNFTAEMMEIIECDVPDQGDLADQSCGVQYLFKVNSGDSTIRIYRSVRRRSRPEQSVGNATHPVPECLVGYLKKHASDNASRRLLAGVASDRTDRQRR